MNYLILSYLSGVMAVFSFLISEVIGNLLMWFGVYMNEKNKQLFSKEELKNERII